jgi:small subunit ribosomal protein S15
VTEVAVKAQIIKDFAVKEGDTGSSEVQVALLTDRIIGLTAHMKEHKHDFHTRRGLLNMVSRRNKLLKYLRGKSADRYRSLIKRLNLRDKF